VSLWLLARHLLSFMVTILVVMAVWAVVTAPMVAIFLIDDAPVAADYVKAAAEVTVYVVLATVVIAPVALGLERVARKGGRGRAVMATLLPVGLIAGIAAGVVALIKYVDTSAQADAVAASVLLMLTLGIYWTTLWTLNLAAHLLGRLRDHRRYGARAGRA
jgi:hypothetical protein